MNWRDILALVEGLVIPIMGGLIVFLCKQNYQAGCYKARLNGHDVELKDLKEWLTRIEEKIDKLILR